MSNVKTQSERKVTKSVGTAPATTPSVGKGARNIDPDDNPWERQHGESKGAYDAFLRFRDDDERRVGTSSVHRAWSSNWSWGYRAFEYDRYLQRKDLEDAVRYRRRMNDRQRRAATLAQQKVIEWLMHLDPSTLHPTEAARWMEVAVRIERLAGGSETERVTVNAQGPIENLTAEEVNEALQALVSEVNRLVT